MNEDSFAYISSLITNRESFLLRHPVHSQGTQLLWSRPVNKQTIILDTIQLQERLTCS